MHLFTRRNEKLGVVSVSAGAGRLYAPRFLASGHGKLYFTSKPYDVNDEAERDHGPYPSRVVGSCAIPGLLAAQAQPSATVASTVFEWRDGDDEDGEDEGSEDEGGDADEEWSPEADLADHGEPLEIVVGERLIFVLTVKRDIGARPWEYHDDEYEQGQARREHRVFVFNEGETRHHHRFSLGAHSAFDAPRSLACVSSRLLVPQRASGDHNEIHIWSAAGERLHKVHVTLPVRLQPRPTSMGFQIVHLCAANSKLYVSAHDDLLVFSWDETTHLLQLVQSAHVSDHFEASALDLHVPMNGRCRRAMRPCVDEHHVCMLTARGGSHEQSVRVLRAQLFAVHGGDPNRS